MILAGHPDHRLLVDDCILHPAPGGVLPIDDEVVLL